jgi:AraC family transcriptional regulator
MDPKIVSRPAFTVVGLKYRGKNENKEIPQLWDQLMPRAGEIAGRVNPQVAYGVEGNFDMNSGEFDYLAGFEVSDENAAPAGMSVWRVPEQTYAVFACTLPTLMETMGHIYQTWLPQSGYQHGGGPEFEFYDEHFDPHDDRSTMYLYVPIR